MDRFARKMNELMIMMAEWYQFSLLTELLSKEYFDLIIQRKRLVPMIVGDPYITRPRISIPLTNQRVQLRKKEVIRRML